MKLKMEFVNITQTFKQHNGNFKLQRDVLFTERADQMFKALVAATPIDTGFARKSWKKWKSDVGVEIYNSAPYIEYLNRGSSKQAPAFFIEQTAMKYGTPLGAIAEPYDFEIGPPP